VELGLAFVIIACVVGFLMAWGVGANDLANMMSTTMASGSLSVRQAIIIAVIFEFAGALLGGMYVSNTIRQGIINTQLFQHNPQILILGMLATLFSGMTLMSSASFLGMPVSITNAIVGALVGIGAIVLGAHSVHWHIIWMIAICWVCAPIVAGTLALIIFLWIKNIILVADDPCLNAKRYGRYLFFVVGIVLANMIVLKDFTAMNIHLSWEYRVLIVLVIGVVVAFVGHSLSKRILDMCEFHRAKQYDYIEKMFALLMGFTTCAIIFAHGSNDVAIAVGPVSAIYSIVKHNGDVAMKDPQTIWIMVLGCIGVVAGLFIYGQKVIKTVGHGITKLTPSRAFAATIAAAVTVVASTSIGIPVSATQTLVGGVFGIGLARGIDALNLRVVRNILLSWAITVPLAAVMAILYFELFKFILKFI